ncbi:hypothetical protein M5K25_023339 [Dendrobium thyrsiflorum]|uniref:Uncharacterized protein n=1 Tax=Dendrobium thyrsiflorum TaxID=117978 RepID=A0ABD0U7R3_DENTH
MPIDAGFSFDLRLVFHVKNSGVLLLPVCVLDIRTTLRRKISNSIAAYILARNNYDDDSNQDPPSDEGEVQTSVEREQAQKEVNAQDKFYYFTLMGSESVFVALRAFESFFFFFISEAYKLRPCALYEKKGRKKVNGPSIGAETTSRTAANSSPKLPKKGEGGRPFGQAQNSKKSPTVQQPAIKECHGNPTEKGPRQQAEPRSRKCPKTAHRTQNVSHKASTGNQTVSRPAQGTNPSATQQESNAQHREPKGPTGNRGGGGGVERKPKRQNTNQKTSVSSTKESKLHPSRNLPSSLNSLFISLPLILTLTKIIPLKPTSPPCMTDLELDHGFMYDDQGRTDLLRSPFFDLNLNVDDTVDNYVDRILFMLVPSIEEHLPTGNWRIIGLPLTSPPSATFPMNTTLGITCLLVASLGLLGLFQNKIPGSKTKPSAQITCYTIDDNDAHNGKKRLSPKIDEDNDRKCLRSSVSYPKPKRTNAKTAVYSRKTAKNRGKTHLDAESFRNQHLGYENLLFPFQNQHLDAEFFQIQHLGGRIPPSSRLWNATSTSSSKEFRNRSIRANYRCNAATFANLSICDADDSQLREIGDRSCLLAPPRPPPEFCRTTAGPPPDAGVSPDHHTRPDVLPNHHLRPDVLPDHHLRPDVLSDHHLRPDVLPDHHLRPDVLPNHHLRPDVPPDHHLRPNVLPNNHLRPDVLPEHHLKPDVLPDNHLRPDVLPDHHLRPNVLSDHHLRPDVLLDHHLRPDVLPDHRLTPNILPDHHLTPNVLPDHRLTSYLRRTTA